MIMLETERLYMREMTYSDYPALCKILQDDEVMYAYEGAFDDSGVREWLDRQISRYNEYEHIYGLWAVILRESGEMIGQCGITKQDCDGKDVLEIGYLFQKAYWHNGYATEAAVACKQYAFNTLNIDEIYSIIRDNNIASQNVAKRNGMAPKGMFTKPYRGVDMPHIIFSVKKKGK